MMKAREFLENKELLSVVKEQLVSNNNELDDKTADKVLEEDESGFSFFCYDMDYDDEQIHNIALEWEMLSCDHDLDVIYKEFPDKGAYNSFSSTNQYEVCKHKFGKSEMNLNVDHLLMVIDSMENKDEDVQNLRQWLVEVRINEDGHVRNLGMVFDMCKDSFLLIALTYKVLGNIQASIVLTKDSLNAKIKGMDEEKMNKKRGKKKFFKSLKKNISIKKLFCDAVTKLIDELGLIEDKRFKEFEEDEHSLNDSLKKTTDEIKK